jgi:uncharacterized OB-fold protein
VANGTSSYPDEEAAPSVSLTLTQLRLLDAVAGDVCPRCGMAICTADAWCPVCSTPAP